MSSDGKLVVTLSKDCTSRIWDAQTGDCLHVLQGGRSPVCRACACTLVRQLSEGPGLPQLAPVLC